MYQRWHCRSLQKYYCASWYYKWGKIKLNLYFTLNHKITSLVFRKLKFESLLTKIFTGKQRVFFRIDEHTIQVNKENKAGMGKQMFSHKGDRDISHFLQHSWLIHEKVCNLISNQAKSC